MDQENDPNAHKQETQNAHAHEQETASNRPLVKL